MKKISKIFSLNLSKKVGKLAVEKKAENVIILNISKISSFCDYFVIMTAKATTHIDALLEYIIQEIKKLYGIRPTSIEGEEAKQWVLLDYGSVIVHIMTEETRDFYKLENIWYKAKKIKVEEKRGKIVYVKK